MPSDALLIDCKIYSPPSVLTKDAQAKIYIRQVMETKKCNERFKTLREWKVQQKELYK